MNQIKILVLPVFPCEILLISIKKILFFSSVLKFKEFCHALIYSIYIPKISIEKPKRLLSRQENAAKT